MKSNCVEGVLLIALAFCVVFVSGCGSLTGIPGHGGGKRFAVEQELIAAATRATIKEIDLSTLKGKKVNLYMNAIGDAGIGNLTGGRFSLVSQIRGDYIQTAPVTENSIYPRYNSYTNTQSSSDSTSDTSNGSGSTGQDSSTSSSSYSSSSSTTSTLLSSPEKKTTQQEGSGTEMQVGLEYTGLGAYKGSEEVSSNDLQYLSGLLQTYLFLQGVHIVPPSEAEIDVYVTVDVFGTVRTRVEWFIANNEILRAKAAIEVMAVEHLSGKLVMSPQSASVEAEYNEQYIIWAGPVMITKFLKKSSPLLSDYTDLQTASETAEYREQSDDIPYPFRHQIDKWNEAEER